MTVKLDKFEVQKLILACDLVSYDFIQMANDTVDADIRKAHIESAIRYRSIGDKLREQIYNKEEK